MVHIDLEHYNPVKLYGYTSSVRDRIAEQDTTDEIFKENRRIRGLERDFRNMIDKLENDARENNEYIRLNDNKIVLELEHKSTGVHLFFGQYDGMYSIGLSVEQRFGRVYDFTTKEWSNYKSETVD